MNRFRLQAYLEEFPFLLDIIEDTDPDTIRVKRVDENLLRFTPRYSRHDGSMGKTKVDEKVHFVLTDDFVIWNAVEQEGRVSSNYAGEQPYSWEGETVLEAIDRHGVAENLAFIVVEQYHLHDWEGQEYTKEYSFTIYKPPKGTSFGEEIKKAKAQALAEVRAEADF